MNTEAMMLALACGMTMLAYMIAINAHGSTRLSLSYLMATIMLAATVWGIVQYVNSDLDAKKMEQIKKIEQEKQLAEERIQSQEEALKANRERMGYATKLSAIVSTGTGLASTILNVDLQNRSVDLSVLMGRAAETKRKVEELKETFGKIGVLDSSFSETIELLKGAIQSLTEAAYYYRSFYYSEDSEQERLRERVLRQKARAAYDQFQKVATSIASYSADSK